MCEFCFNEHFESFETSEKFEEVDLILTQKLGREHLQFIKNVTLKYGGLGYYIYKCKNCNTKWYLSEPEYSWRGFLLPEKTALDKLKKTQGQDKILKLLFLLIVIVIVLLIVYLIQ